MTIDLFDSKRRHGGLSVADRIDASGDCWLWTGSQIGTGYCQVRYGGKPWLVHRLIWTALVGPISEDSQIDHLCRVRNCVNPDHLEVVTPAENASRGFGNAADINRKKKNCPRGHPYSGNNLYITPKGNRRCRECDRTSHRRRYTVVAERNS